MVTRGPLTTTTLGAAETSERRRATGRRSCARTVGVEIRPPTHPPSAPHPGTDTTLKPRQRPRPSPPASCVRPHVDGLCAGLTGPAAGAGECGNRWRGANLSGIREASPRPLRYPALRRRPRGTASAPYETRKRVPYPEFGRVAAASTVSGCLRAWPQRDGHNGIEQPRPGATAQYSNGRPT